MSDNLKSGMWMDDTIPSICAGVFVGVEWPFMTGAVSWPFPFGELVAEVDTVDDIVGQGSSWNFQNKL